MGSLPIARTITLAFLLASCGSSGDSSTKSVPASSAPPATASSAPPVTAAASVPPAASSTATTGSPASVEPTTPTANSASAVTVVMPELIEMLPASGPAGAAYPLQATVRGRGFTATGNAVVFGPVTIADLPSTDGTRITFDVPKLVRSRGEVPPMVLTAGEYTVVVTTASGTSNALVFTLTRSP
jgi:hypothetical protein